MQFFRDLDKAIAVQAQASVDYVDRFYEIVQTNNSTPTWVIEVRDKDGAHMGWL
jgi:hypothetical protein